MSKKSTSFRTYKDYRGANIEQMPRLLKEGRKPLSFRELVENPTLVKDYVDLGDLALYNKDARLKVVPVDKAAAFFEQLRPGAELYEGALVITDEMYDNTQGTEFTLHERGLYSGKIPLLEMVLNNQIVLALAGLDAVRLQEGCLDTLKEFCRDTFEIAKSCFMIIVDKPKKFNTARLWSFSNNGMMVLDATRDLSEKKDISDMTKTDGYLIGVAQRERIVMPYSDRSAA